MPKFPSTLRVAEQIMGPDPFARDKIDQISNVEQCHGVIHTRHAAVELRINVTDLILLHAVDGCCLEATCISGRQIANHNRLKLSVTFLHGPRFPADILLKFISVAAFDLTLKCKQ